MRSVPMILTAANVCCGIAAIILAIQGNMVLPIWLLLAAALFDGMDGWVARRLNVDGLAGANADTSADIVSFGVAPTVMVMQTGNTWAVAAGVFYGLMILARLIRYRMIPMPSGTYAGLPSPIAALPVTAAVQMTMQGGSPLLTIIVTVIIGILAILPMGFPSWQHPSINQLPIWLRLTYFSGSIICLFFWTEESVLIILSLYIVVSPWLLSNYHSRDVDLSEEETSIHDRNR